MFHLRLGRCEFVGRGTIRPSTQSPPVDRKRCFTPNHHVFLAHRLGSRVVVVADPSLSRSPSHEAASPSSCRRYRAPGDIFCFRHLRYSLAPGAITGCDSNALLAQLPALLIQFPQLLDDRTAELLTGPSLPCLSKVTIAGEQPQERCLAFFFVISSLSEFEH